MQLHSCKNASIFIVLELQISTCNIFYFSFLKLLVLNGKGIKQSKDVTIRSEWSICSEFEEKDYMTIFLPFGRDKRMKLQPQGQRMIRGPIVRQYP